MNYVLGARIKVSCTRDLHSSEEADPDQHRLYVRVPFPVADDGKFIPVLHRASGFAALDFGLESNSSFYAGLSPLLPESM